MAIIKQIPTVYSSTTTPDDFCEYFRFNNLENDAKRKYFRVTLYGYASKQARKDGAPNKMVLDVILEGDEYPLTNGVLMDQVGVYSACISRLAWVDATIDSELWE